MLCSWSTVKTDGAKRLHACNLHGNAENLIQSKKHNNTMLLERSNRACQCRTNESSEWCWHSYMFSCLISKRSLSWLSYPGPVLPFRVAVYITLCHICHTCFQTSDELATQFTLSLPLHNTAGASLHRCVHFTTESIHRGETPLCSPIRFSWISTDLGCQVEKVLRNCGASHSHRHLLQRK